MIYIKYYKFRNILNANSFQNLNDEGLCYIFISNFYALFAHVYKFYDI